jgi:hypothetical protein
VVYQLIFSKNSNNTLMKAIIFIGLMFGGFIGSWLGDKIDGGGAGFGTWGFILGWIIGPLLGIWLGYKIGQTWLDS